ncbi:hypothetical protein FQR65_LT13789 [Abscondita terminalis]|nr:hypothetical protein FQR65_LT13789 [Abscondita terminalis]
MHHLTKFEPVKLIRLGKVSSKRRPIKVCFADKDSAIIVLKAVRTMGTGNIKFSSDRTQSQRDYLKSLYEELHRRKSEGETNLLIKYVNGNPFVLNKGTNPGLNKKHSPKFLGLFKIIRVNNNNSIQMQTNRKIVTTTTNKLKPVVLDDADLNIVNDECCVQKTINITNIPIQLQPVKIINTKLEELQYANHKLQQLDLEINNQLRKPLTIQTTHWYNSLLPVIGSIIAVTILYNLLRWCGIFQIIRQYMCCTKEPRTIKDGCCAKIFNTNISGVPITRQQLSRLIREEEANLAGDVSNKDTLRPTTLHRVDP